jgi:hypothetical protein
VASWNSGPATTPRHCGDWANWGLPREDMGAGFRSDPCLQRSLPAVILTRTPALRSGLLVRNSGISVAGRCERFEDLKT